MDQSTDPTLSDEMIAHLAKRGLIDHPTAARYLGVPVATLHQWNSRGEGPRSFKIGRHRKYRMADLDTFIEARANRSAA